jgi:phosphotriesterase-related protein
MSDETYDYGLAPGETFEPDLDDEEPFDLSQPHLMTALGPIEPGDAGFTLHHEYVIAHPPGGDQDFVLDDPHSALTELEAFYLAGGRTIVDMTTADDGRDAAALAWVAARSPVNLVAATGYAEDGVAAPVIGSREVAAIASEMVRDLREGIDGTIVRAGVIAAGVSHDRITPVEDRVLRAAALAHAETGAAISVRAEGGTMALPAIEVLRQEGVVPSRVIAGHLDQRLDESLLLSVLETGAYVSFDQISQRRYGADEARAAMIRLLVALGYGDQLLLSGGLGRRSAFPAYGGEPGWTYLVEGFPLVLMEEGVPAPVIRQMFVENPARALAIVP